MVSAFIKPSVFISFFPVIPFGNTSVSPCLKTRFLWYHIGDGPARPSPACIGRYLVEYSFIRQYPQFQSSQLKRECGAEKGSLFWDISAGVVFDEYGYCRAASEFNEADNEIRIQGLTPPKFSAQITLYGKSDENYWIKIRSNNTIMLINYANGDYVPALIKIGELLRRGDVFVPSREAEYYVLRRACVLSAEACVDLAPRLARLKADLPPDHAARVELAASDDPSLKPPILVDVLLTGKV